MTASGRQYPDGASREEWAEAGAGILRLGGCDDEAIGAFLQNMLGGTPEPGPPYVHTCEPPPVGLDEYKPYRIEITADFCQCPDCKRERCEP